MIWNRKTGVMDFRSNIEISGMGRPIEVRVSVDFQTYAQAEGALEGIKDLLFPAEPERLENDCS